MSTLNLDALFHPRSLALVGASARPGTPGQVLATQLARSAGPRALHFVNPRYTRLLERPVLPSVDALPRDVDLALLCTPRASVADLLARLGRRGCRAAALLGTGLRAPEQVRALLAAARPWGMRLLGPGSLGLLAPVQGLNASFCPLDPLPGRIALVSESGAMLTSLLDWATGRRIGFSWLVSLGESIDVDLADTIDWLAGDPDTDAVVIYLETVRAARKLMSAARATARHKPLVVLKGGRVREGSLAAASHSGGPAPDDEVFDAAVRRAGMLRVYSTPEVFDAVESLARGRSPRGDRLAILTNGGGPGVVATDELILGGGRLAALGSTTLAALDATLASRWSRGNPVDIGADADARRYARALRELLQAPEVDAVLVLCAPTAADDPARIAAAVVAEGRRVRRALLTCWMGGASLEDARAVSRAGGLPTYDTPYSAVRALLHQLNYRRNQALLMETPVYRALDREPQPAAARSSLRAALIAGQPRLSEPEAKAVLAAYGIPVVPTAVVNDEAGAVAAARAIGFPVVLKIISPDVVRKSDLGGVVLDLADEAELLAALAGLRQRLARNRPGARLTGFAVQQMVRRAGARELFVAVRVDPVFGPVVSFGLGGKAGVLAAERALALPPLNATLARDLIDRAPVARWLRAESAGAPAPDLGRLEALLVRVSQLVIDCPEVVELEINPLLFGPDIMTGLDARLRVATPRGDGRGRLAIRPYPAELEERVTLVDGRAVLLRPIRPEDEPAHREFLGRIDTHDLYLRFFSAAKQFDHERLARLTQVDYDREMALIASLETEGGAETLGVVRAVIDADATQAEFALLVRSDSKRRGLGRLLMDKLVRYARGRGLARLVGDVLPENHGMLALLRSLGFELGSRDEDGTLHMALSLLEPAAGG